MPFSLGFLDRILGGKNNARFASVADIVPDMTGKVVVITGANSGVGQTSAMETARKGAHVIMLCRSKERADPVVEAIKKETGNGKVEFLQCDLSDWSSVLNCASILVKRDVAIDVLMNNAGIMAPSKYSECKQGIESQMSSNHFGHFLLTRELLPLVKKAKEGRIVVLSSVAHTYTEWNKWFGYAKGFDYVNVLKKEKYSPHANYGMTKMANLLFARELQRQLEEGGVHHVFVNAVHPGAVNTNLATNSHMNSFLGIVKGGMTDQFTGAMTQEKDYKGEYFIPLAQLGKSTAFASQPENQKKLWDWTETILKEKGFHKDWKF